MSLWRVSGGVLSVLIALALIVSLGAARESAGAQARCSGEAVTISWRDDGVGLQIKGTGKRDVIQGSPYPDEINAAGGDDLICAGGGNDEINGGSGGDNMLGQDGDDTFIPGTGDDAIDGGANTALASDSRPGDLVSYDTAKLDDPCDSQEEIDDPNDPCSDHLFATLAPRVLGLPPSAEGAGGFDTFVGVESLRGMREEFNFLYGDTGPNVLIDGDRGGYLQGDEGNDLLFGLDGPDTLSGEGGDDFLDGGSDRLDGSDLLSGGDGTDTCINANPEFVVECESDVGCPAFKPARQSGATRDELACGPEQVVFGFDIDGFPDSPAEKHLPDDLVAVELHTKATRVLTMPGSSVVKPEGKIEMTTTYLTRSTEVVEREVTVRLFSPGVYYELEDGERFVEGAAQVTASEDRNCREGTHMRFIFSGAARRPGKPGHASLELLSGSGSLACVHSGVDPAVLEWKSRRSFKSARLGRPKPVG